MFPIFRVETPFLEGNSRVADEKQIATVSCNSSPLGWWRSWDSWVFSASDAPGWWLSWPRAKNCWQRLTENCLMASCPTSGSSYVKRSVKHWREAVFCGLWAFWDGLRNGCMIWLGGCDVMYSQNVWIYTVYIYDYIYITHTYIYTEDEMSNQT